MRVDITASSWAKGVTSEHLCRRSHSDSGGWPPQGWMRSVTRRSDDTTTGTHVNSGTWGSSGGCSFKYCLSTPQFMGKGVSLNGSLLRTKGSPVSRSGTGCSG